jgi:hypothetical protein
MSLKRVAVFGIALLSSIAPVVEAQIFVSQQKSSAAVGINSVDAPIPDPLLKGKKAFISYELGDVTSFPSRYSGGPERAYSEFFKDMKAWGRYEIVMNPKDADVIFAIRFVDPPDIPKPQIRLGIMDPTTHASLWGFVEEIDFAFRKKSRDADFSDTVQLLVADVQALVQPAAATPVKQP